MTLRTEGNHGLSDWTPPFASTAVQQQSRENLQCDAEAFFFFVRQKSY